MKAHLTLVSALTIAVLVAARAPAAPSDDERIAFYGACGVADPGERIERMAAFLETYPRGAWSDRVRTNLFGVVASGAWREGSPAAVPARVASIVAREGDRYDAGDDPDRLLLLSEAYLRSEVRLDDAQELARRGAALVRTASRPATVSVSSWGRRKRERLARSNYLRGLARMNAADYEAAATFFEKARDVFLADRRFREEHARLLRALGRDVDDALGKSDRAVAAEAIAATDREERIRRYEKYLAEYPGGAQATEIGIRLVEDDLQTKGRGEEASALAAKIGSSSDNPEVLSALAVLLAEANVGTGLAVRLGERGVRILERAARDPATYAEDLPALQADLLVLRDSYGWALLRDGRAEQAVAELKQAAESEHPRVSYHYGVALVESGKRFDAAFPLVEAYTGGVGEAKAYLDAIREKDASLRKHVDDLLFRAEENLRRRKVGDEEVWTPPDFSLVSLDGDVVTLSDLEGEVVVLAVWATWCAPCRQELPHLRRVIDSYVGKGVRFLGVNTDRDFWLVRPFLAKLGIDMTTLLTAGEEDWDASARGFRVSALPTLLVLDRKGNVRYREEGYDGSGVYFEKVLGWRLDRLLEER